MAQDVDPTSVLAWEGVLPVKCVLAPECREVGSTDDNDCHFMVPRQGYLAYSTKVVLKAFRHAVRGDSVYFYFTYRPTKGDPTPVVIPWHYPMGVVVDRLAALDSIIDVTKLFRQAIEFTVNFADTPPPTDTTLPVSVGGVTKGADTVLKQAHKMVLMGQYGSIKPWFKHNVDDYNGFISSARTNDVRGFFAGRSSLLSSCKRELTAEEFERGSGRAFFSLHVNDEVMPLVTSVRDFPTLGTLLRFALPCCYDLDLNQCMSNDPLDPEIAIVLVSGARPALCTPTVFLRDHLCCADLVVHIVVRTKADNSPRPRPSGDLPADGFTEGTLRQSMTTRDFRDSMSEASPNASSPALAPPARSPTTSASERRESPQPGRESPGAGSAPAADAVASDGVDQSAATDAKGSVVIDRQEI